jgi:hypothetical protein
MNPLKVVVVASLVASLAYAAPVAHAAEHVYRTEHFALTWTDDPSDPDAPDLSDRDGDGVPDTVVRMTRAFEDARSFLLGELGYRPPPTRGRYNLYLSAAVDRGLVRPAPGGNGRSRPSFVTIPKHMMRASASEGDVRTFAVHEYFHAIQFGYDAGEDHWIFEASSTWVEGLFGPDRDHNQVYLYDFVPRLELGLKSQEGVHEYGAFLFLQFLTERYGGAPAERAGLVKELWEAMAVPEAIEGAPDDDSFEAIARLLSARGVAVEDAWREFQLWAWQLDRFEKGDLYRRALRDQRWPTAPAVELTSETCALTVTPPDAYLPALAGDYVRLRTARLEQTSNARVAVRGADGATAFAILRPRDGAPVVREIAFDSDGVGILDVEVGGRAAARVILGLGNAATSPIGLEYSARLDGANEVVAHAPLVPQTMIYGTALSVSGYVECGGAPAAGARVFVTRSEPASGEIETRPVVTDAGGRWTLLTEPDATSTFSAVVADPLLSEASSTPATVGVKVAVNIAVADDQLEEGETLTVEGNVAPVHAGRVVLERRRPHGRFEIAAETIVDGEGNYRFDHVLPAPGVWEVRVTMPDTGDHDHLPGDSVPKVIQVGET